MMMDTHVMFEIVRNQYQGTGIIGVGNIWIILILPEVLRNDP